VINFTPEMYPYMTEFDKVIAEFYEPIPREFRYKYRFLKYGRFTSEPYASVRYFTLSPEKSKDWLKCEDNNLVLNPYKSTYFPYGDVVVPRYGNHDCIIPKGFFDLPLEDAISELKNELEKHIKYCISEAKQYHAGQVSRHKTKLETLDKLSEMI
jgi:hypothetical protein